MRMEISFWDSVKYRENYFTLEIRDNTYYDKRR